MDLLANFFIRYQPMFLKLIDPVVVTLWRLGLGRLFNLWPTVAGRIMVMKHFDYKNGIQIFTPMNFIERDNIIYCTDQRGQISGWVQNIMANPQVEVWLPDGWYAGQADLVDPSTDRLSLLRSFLVENPIFSRISGIDPQSEDIEFESAVENYPLARIMRQSPRTGVNGPGGLAWMWPFILMFLLGLRPRKRR
jgi:hypothetical protein